jgi:hypothetical protein
MKKGIYLIAICGIMTSCSTCYECSEDVIIYSGNNPTDTVTNSDELCAADQAEIDDREAAGATCIAQ